jgi:hypothetical protein
MKIPINRAGFSDESDLEAMKTVPTPVIHVLVPMVKSK